MVAVARGRQALLICADSEAAVRMAVVCIFAVAVVRAAFLFSLQPLPLAQARHRRCICHGAPTRGCCVVAVEAGSVSANLDLEEVWRNVHGGELGEAKQSAVDVVVDGAGCNDDGTVIEQFESRRGTLVLEGAAEGVTGGGLLVKH